MGFLLQAVSRSSMLKNPLYSLLLSEMILEGLGA